MENIGTLITLAVSFAVMFVPPFALGIAIAAGANREYAPRVS
jgi:hypothetical protein